MSRLDRYVLSQLVSVFGFFALVLIAIYWVNRAIRTFDRLIADGQSALVFLEVTALALPNVILLVLPVACFAAAVYVTNRLTSESERVVAEAAGMSGARLMRPYLAFGVMVGLVVAVLAHALVPASRAQLYSRQTEISRDFAARLILPGQFIHPSDGVTFYIREVSAAGELRDVFLHDSRDPSRILTYTAESAFLVRDATPPRLVMFDGMAQELTAAGVRLSTVIFDDYSLEMTGFLPGDGSVRTDIREIPSAALWRADPALLAAVGLGADRFRLELHERVVKSLLPPLYAAVGLAALMLGGFSRFGLWRQVGVAIGVVVALWTLGSQAEEIAAETPARWPLLYLQVAVGVGAVAALLALAGRPALFAPARLRARARARRPA